MAASANEPRRPLAAMKPDKWYAKMAIHKVPATYLLGAFLISYLTLAIAWLEGSPPWLAFGLALIPWGLIAFVEVEFTYKHFGWLALFWLMAFVQTIHYSEHCIEIVQYHLFHNPLKESLAIFSKLNVEGVHFGGDSFLTLGTLALLWKFPRNKWLWVAMPFQILHQMEHNFLFFTYAFKGAPAGAPGVLGDGGVAWGGLGLKRVDLHWIYNTLYTIPFVMALIWQLKRSYDENLEIAFPDTPQEELLAASKHMATFHYSPGETILAPGDDADRLYIITEGTAIVSEHDAQGNEVETARLHQGQFFGEVGLLRPDVKHTHTVRALSNITVLAMDDETFIHLNTVSKAAHDDIISVADQRLAETTPAGPMAPEAG